MKRFVIVKDNKIIAERYGLEIVDGEIEDDGTFGGVGQLNENGNWIDDVAAKEQLNKGLRINELRQLIHDKKLLDLDCSAEQIELKQLLGL